jgi:hypothetical protein
MEINPNKRSASMTVSAMALAMLVCSQLGV